MQGHECARYYIENRRFIAHSFEKRFALIAPSLTRYPLSDEVVSLLMKKPQCRSTSVTNTNRPETQRSWRM